MRSLTITQGRRIQQNACLRVWAVPGYDRMKYRRMYNAVDMIMITACIHSSDGQGRKSMTAAQSTTESQETTSTGRMISV